MVVMDHKMKWLKSRKPLIVLYFPFKTSLYQNMVTEIMFIPCWAFLSTCYFIEEFCCVLRFHIHLGRDIVCLFLRDFVFIIVLVKTNWLGKFKDQVASLVYAITWAWLQLTIYAIILFCICPTIYAIICIWMKQTLMVIFLLSHHVCTL